MEVLTKICCCRILASDRASDCFPCGVDAPVWKLTCASRPPEGRRIGHRISKQAVTVSEIVVCVKCRARLGCIPNWGQTSVQFARPRAKSRHRPGFGKTARTPSCEPNKLHVRGGVRTEGIARDYASASCSHVATSAAGTSTWSPVTRSLIATTPASSSRGLTSAA